MYIADALLFFYASHKTISKRPGETPCCFCFFQFLRVAGLKKFHYPSKFSLAICPPGQTDAQERGTNAIDH